MQKALQVAIIGLGGFARLHHESLRKLESLGEARLVATCDPHFEQAASPEVLAELEKRGVRVYRDYSEMLDAHRAELDIVTIPTPIPLHAPMHRACVERGLAVYLEKPPTLDPIELEAMIDVEKEARFETQVGFNFIVEVPRQRLKARLLSGEFGALKRAGFLGFWPRPNSYFRRASWAGRLSVGNHLVLDSCVGNAMAHYIHNLLFWCGQNEVFSWGPVEEVEAELYRAHAIESFDTVFARGVSGKSQICVGASHAGSGGNQWHREWLECEDADIVYNAPNGYEITWHDGRREYAEGDHTSVGDLLTLNLLHFVRYLRGEETRPLSTLADTRPFVQFNALLFVSARRIATVPEDFLLHTTTQRGEEHIAIRDIESQLEHFARESRLPFESEVSWSRRGGRAVGADVPQLEGVVARMLADGQ